ncbi:MAG: hypothetical protein JJU02_12295 [Cryomorphaceae bacterium]|nr:hypothetical protein [Cryomorphaceae bacterium]
MSWIVSKEPIQINDFKTINFGSLYFSHMENLKIFKIGDYSVLIDGYIVPRIDFVDINKGKTQEELLQDSFIEKSFNFVNDIKGVFNIVFLKKDFCCIVNDPHSLKKYFYIDIKDKFAISSNLINLSNLHDFRIDFENVAMFCIMEHFVGGYSLFKDIKYSLPAQVTKFDGISGNIDVRIYYNILDSVKENRASISYNDFASKWNDIINSYLSFLNPKDITITITGGNDSRMILASLYNLGLKPKLFTFGNPKSFDGIIAEEIAEKLDLNFNNYFVENFNSDWFSLYCDKIIDIGETLVNIHRAHRLDAIEKEIKQNPDVEMLFGGFMGGDYVKGLIYDDYITPEFLKDFEATYHCVELKDLVIKFLKKKFINIDNINLDVLVNRIKHLPFINQSSLKLRKLSALYYLVGSMHDTQDSFLFSEKVRYVVNPFMDVDFLDLLYSYNESFLDFEDSFKYNVLRMERSRMHTSVTHILCPEISGIFYAKKGHYTTIEYLFSNPIVLLFKRFFRFKFKSNFPQNFPYSNAYVYELKALLDNINESDLSVLFDLDGLNNYLELLHEYTSITEGKLHEITNPINLFLNIKKFKSN